MIFGVLNPEKIWHQYFVHLPTSPVYCSHFTLGNPKKSFFNSIIHIYFKLYMLSQKKQTVTSLPNTLEKCHRTTLYNAQIFQLLHFSHVSSTNPRYGRVAEESCCDVGWISAEHGGRCSWSVAKKTGSMYPCRRWSLWTFAVTLLAWHSLCHTSQPVLFRATNTNPQPAFCQSRQR